MLGGESSPLRDRQRVARGQRAQYRRKGRLASAILGIDEGKASEGDGRAGVDGIELPDVPKELDPADHALTRCRNSAFFACPLQRPVKVLTFR